MKYLLILLILIFASCSDDDSSTENLSNLEGKWVETETRTDTLSFESLDDLEIMFLNRGKEIKDGNTSPKSGSGPYSYYLAQQIIALNWMLSSNSAFNDYYFEVEGNSLKIGNFYGSASGEILTFERLD